MKKTGLKCPFCHRALNHYGAKHCPRCEGLLKVIGRTSCSYLLEQEKIGFNDIKSLLHNWPINIQQEFVRAIAVFNIKQA